MKKLLTEWRKYLEESVPPPDRKPRRPHPVCQDEYEKHFSLEASKAAVDLNYSCAMALMRYVTEVLGSNAGWVFDRDGDHKEWVLYDTSSGPTDRADSRPVPKCDSSGDNKEYCYW